MHFTQTGQFKSLGGRKYQNLLFENHSVCVKDLYLIALGFEKLPDGLKLRFPVQDISTNAYVWIHYFTLIGMEDASCFQALVELVLADSTILKLPRDTQLCLLNLMIEFAAQYQQGCDSTKLVQLFYRLYKILPVSQIYPADIGMVFGEHLLSEMKSSIIEIDATRIFNKIPLSVGEEVANQLMNLECKIAFPVSFIQNLLDKDRINSAKQILVYSLNRNPTNPYYWKLLIHLNGGEDTQLGNSLWNLSKLYLISPFQS
ncbi:hypothetical protein BC833DRAFT_52585 [Globomyces pollinis-pini]|nr:hypothetical protein BC833DRAFT_52585 [Globomyces pollinis-pini]